jgi:hypothetical protein
MDADGNAILNHLCLSASHLWLKKCFSVFSVCYVLSVVRPILVVFALAAAPVAAATASKAPQAKLVQIRVEPGALELTGERDRARLVVTGRYSDGSVRDLTSAARLRSSQPEVARIETGAGEGARTPVVLPAGDGAATITASVPGVAPAVAQVSVKGSRKPEPVSFHHEVIPVLTRAGCNMGTCHGTPTGKGGFRLSLQGFAPGTDYEHLTREAGGRRASRSAPEASLILKKPLGRVPHRGGQRFGPESPEHQLLRRWIAEGLRSDPPEAPRLVRLEVLPATRMLMKPARTQQLVVRAHFSDGGQRDVSHLVKFSSSDEAIAQVTSDGLVTGQRRGEAAILCRYEHLVGSARFTFLDPVPEFRWPSPVARNYVDQHVFARLRLMRFPPADLTTDAEFLRRATLDTLGVLPTPDEVRDFLADGSPDKREKLIDRLLERPEFADLWAMKWSDLLRVREETLDGTGARAYHAWIREAIAAKKPLDQFARELITASGDIDSSPPANFYRAVSDPTNWMETTAQLFMGRRVQCAKCHNHPFDRMTQDEYYSLAAFFSQVQVQTRSRPDDQGRRRRRGAPLRTVALDPDAQMVQPRTGEVMPPRFPGGAAPPVAPESDRRQVLARWLTDSTNPYFAPAMANRIWFHLMGRGIVEPVDDFRETNPSTNDALLKALAQDLVAHRYDLRHLVRAIMRSTTYQLSARPHPLSREDTVYFSHAVPRLLPAEVLFDAVSTATGVAEPFPGLPETTRAVLLPGTAQKVPFLAAFGRPARTLACECERDREPTLYQALQLISSRMVERKLQSDQGRVARLVAAQTPDAAAIEELYLATLSRPPTPPERQAALAALRGSENRRAGLEDLLWALLNAKEFLFRH